MATRNLPGIGLEIGWAYGEDGWNDGMDSNLRKLSTLAQLSVLSRTTSLSGTPSNGDIYIVPVGDSNGDSVALRDADTWHYFTPHEGARAWVVDDEIYVRWNGSEWVPDSVAGSATTFGTVADLLAVSAAALSDGDSAYVREYHAGTGHGGGHFFWDAASSQAPDGGLVFKPTDAGSTGRWRRAEAAGNGPLKLQWWGITASDSTANIAAVKAAVKALYSTRCNLLDCENIPVRITSMIELGNSDISIGAGPTNNNKYIIGLHLFAASDSANPWAAGDSMFYIHGDESISLLYRTVFRDCFINADNLVDYGFRASAYWHLRLADSHIVNFLKGGVYASSEYAPVGGGHDFEIIDCDIRVPFNQGAGKTGIISEDMDFVVNGGWTYWCQVGMRLKGGAFVRGHHFAGGADYGIICSLPQKVMVQGCDFDGCGILFDDADAPVAGWQKLVITDNEFVMNASHVEGGVLVFRANAANANVSGFVVDGNTTISGSDAPTLDFVKFEAAGAGNWSATWEGIYNHAPSPKVNDGTFPARNKLCGGTINYVFTESQGLVVRCPAVLPWTDNTRDMGLASHRWRNFYGASSTIVTSDEREKTEIGPIPDEWLDAWGVVEWSRYKVADSVEEKGDGARWHVGLIAQRVRDAFLSHGIDPFSVGILCFDEWDERPAVVDEDGRVLEPYRPAGGRFGIRYDEAMALEAAWMRRELARIKSRF